MQALLAQALAAATSEQPFKIAATADIVLPDVSVRDAAGEHVSNLGREGFQVYENGKLQRAELDTED